MGISLWSSKECSLLRPSRPSSVGQQCGNSKNFPADHNNNSSDPVQIRMTIFHFYTPTFHILQKIVASVYINKFFTSEIDSKFI